MRGFAYLFVAALLAGALGPLVAASAQAATASLPEPKRIVGPHLMIPDPAVHPTAPFVQVADEDAAGTRGGGSEPTQRTTGVVNVLVVLIQFTDVTATVSSASITTALSDTTPQAASVHNYYAETSYGLLDLRFTVTPWYTSVHPMDYYGRDSASGYDDANGPIYRLTTEAVQTADANGQNFAPFDEDNDGVVDHLVVIHAGDAEESDTNRPNLIWSHRWSVIDANPGFPGDQQLTADGKQVYGYTMVAETSPIGVVAHEFGHDLGLPDLYDTDGSSSGGVGEWDIMATGSWNGSPRGSQPAHMSAWAKMKLGWLAPTVVNSALLGQPIAQSETNPVAFQLPIRSSPAGGEYFLVENRQSTGFDASLPGAGLLIWHVDDAVSGNQDDAHRLVNLEEADGNSRPTQATDAWSDNPTGWGPDTTPNSNSYLNQRTGWKVRNIGPAASAMLADISREVDDDLLILGFQRPCCVRTGTAAVVNVTVGNHGARLQTGFNVSLTIYRGSVAPANVVCCGNRTVASLAQGQATNLSWTHVVGAPGKYILEADVPLARDEIPENNVLFAHFNAATYYLHDDVESGVRNWTRNGTGFDPAQWAIVRDGNASVSYSPVRAWRFGPVMPGPCLPPLCPGFHSLTWTNVSVPAGGPLYFSFWHTYDLRGRVEVNGSVETDTAYVNVSVNGAPWRVMGRLTGAQPGWQAFAANLTSFVSGVGPWEIAIQLSASSKAVQSTGGWWVDDIALSNTELSRGLITRIVTPDQTVEPGGVATFRFKLANVGDFDDDVTFALDLSQLPGWSAGIGENTSRMETIGTYVAHLSPDKEATLFLAFQVAAGAPRGYRYTIPVTATSTNNTAISATFDTVTIIADPFGLAGLERYVFFFLVMFAVIIVIAVVIDAVKKQKGVYRRW